MTRPVLMGLVGDSATGKTTITRGLVRVLGEDNVTHIGVDDYHRYDRRQRAERGITPLNPDCNYLDIMLQDLLHLRAGEPILKPVYQHSDGTFAPPVYVKPNNFAIAEGLLGFHSQELRDVYDLRVYLAPPEDLRRKWKVGRDCSRRGYTTNEVLAELDKREPDSEMYIRPQRHHADIVVSFQAAKNDDPEHLPAELALSEGLAHPDLAPFANDGSGIEVEEDGTETHMKIPGDLTDERTAEIEEAIWAELHFARHLRAMRLGEFTIGTDLHRSNSLALVQLLILYHMVTARAAVAVGGDNNRAEGRGVREPEPEAGEEDAEDDEDFDASGEDAEAEDEDSDEGDSEEEQDEDAAASSSS